MGVKYDKGLSEEMLGVTGTRRRWCDREWDRDRQGPGGEGPDLFRSISG